MPQRLLVGMSQSQASSTPAKYPTTNPNSPPSRTRNTRRTGSLMAIIVAPRKVIVVYRHQRVWILQLALLRSFRNVKEVPFPGFALVGRKRLTPDRAVFVPGVPPEDDDDWLPFEGVFAKEMSDTILK